MCSHGYYHDVGGGDLLSPSCASLLHSLKVASANFLYVARHYCRPTNLHSRDMNTASHCKSTLGDQIYPRILWVNLIANAGQTHSLASCIIIYLYPTDYSCFQNHAFSDRKAIYFMHTSKLGSWQKLVPIACWLSNPVTMAATVKRLQKKKEWHCQLKSSRCSFYKFPCVHAKFLISLTAPVTFFNLVSERLHLASECSSQRVAVRGCFGRKDFLLFLSGTVWYAALLFCDNAGLVADMKAGFV